MELKQKYELWIALTSFGIDTWHPLSTKNKNSDVLVGTAGTLEGCTKLLMDNENELSYYCSYSAYVKELDEDGKQVAEWLWTTTVKNGVVSEAWEKELRRDS